MPPYFRNIGKRLVKAPKLYLARGLRAIMEDTGAQSATILDQGLGTDPLAPGGVRRGFAEASQWLPGD